MPQSLSKSRSLAYKRQKGRCYYCRAPIWLENLADFAAKYKITDRQAVRFQCTTEHLKARQDGGTNTRENIVAACRFRKKGSDSN